MRAVRAHQFGGPELRTGEMVLTSAGGGGVGVVWP